MAMIYDKVLHKICGAEELPGVEYEGCTFRECVFSDCDFSEYDFSDCVFERCTLVMTKFDEAGMRDVVFEGCEVRGVDFGLCRKFGFSVSFRNCQLSFCSFHELKMSRAVFAGCVAKECFFSECDLSRADFSGCSLERTLFERCLMKDADFRTAFDYTIDPESNRLRGAKFSREGLAGLLVQYGLVIEE